MFSGICELFPTAHRHFVEARDFLRSVLRSVSRHFRPRRQNRRSDRHSPADEREKFYELAPRNILVLLPIYRKIFENSIVHVIADSSLVSRIF